MAQPAPPERGAAIDDASKLTARTWRFLEKEMRHLGTPLPEPVVPVLEFLESAEKHRTRPKQRLAIVEQAELLFEHVYAHMPFKTELFHVDHPREFLTYSAADIFAAGFQDHGIGFIFGMDQNTGGGRGNVWEHSDLLTKLGPDPGIPLAPLPRDVSMAVAGRAIEDFGVGSNDVYTTITVDDILRGSPGVIEQAAQIIGRRMPLFRVDVVSFERRTNGGVSVQARSNNVASLRFFLDGELSVERRSRPGRVATFVVPPAKGVSDPSALRIEGISGTRLVAVRNVALDGKVEEESDAEESERVARRRRRRR